MLIKPVPRPKLAPLTLLIIGLTLTSLLLAACGDSSPTPKPTVAPTATASPPPPPAWLAQVDFDFADEAEKAQREFVTSRPDFAAWVGWTENNHWFVLVRDNQPDKLRQKLGRESRLTPVTYLADALSSADTRIISAYSLILSRTSVDVKAGGAKEAARALFNRAVNGLKINGGLLIFTLGDDQLRALVLSTYSPEQILPLASLGKLEVVGAGTENLADNSVVTTSNSPLLGDLKPKNARQYQTVADNNDFGTFGVGASSAVGAASLSFELRPGSRVYDYTRANIGKYLTLVLDRQVVASVPIRAAIRDKGEMQATRWASLSGREDLQNFVTLLNAQPRQLFEAKELVKTNNLVFSGSLTR